MIAACTPHTVESSDLGNAPGDLGMPDELSAGDGPVGAGSTLGLVAGGIGGFGNGDAIGRAARFLNPIAVAADGVGNLYIADSMASTIRKVVLATATVSTIAGTAGISGSADGTGAAARFKQPSGVAADGAGNLYVTDSFYHTIRKVVLATGVVSTIAGLTGACGSADGTGAAARFCQPSGVAADGAGNLYIADTSNSTIRMMVLTTGAVSTIAGTPFMSGSANGTGAAARFNTPSGVAADGAGNLYIADTGNNTIRKVVLANSVVSTIAGTAGMLGSADGTAAAARFNQPYGVAVDGTGNLYVGDLLNYTIRKMVLATGSVSTIAGTAGMLGSADGTGPAARFGGPTGVAMDTGGNLYVSEPSNYAIRKVVLADGAVSTIVGTASMPGSADGSGTAARFNRPAGVAADEAGNLYVCDANNDTIRKVVLATGVVSTIAGTPGMRGNTDGIGASARFDYPQEVAVDGAGNLYIADTNNSTIRKVVLATSVVSTIAGTAAMSGSADGTGATAQFNQPIGLAADGAGNLYVADTYNSTIRKVVLATSVVSTIAGTAFAVGSADGIGAAARFRLPSNVAADRVGNLYVADTGNNTIRKIVLATGVVTTIAGTAGMGGIADGNGSVARFLQPYGMTADGAGNLYVADFGNATVRKILLATGGVTTLVGMAGQTGVKLGPIPARLNGPAFVTTVPTGELIIVDIHENSVLAVR